MARENLFLGRDVAPAVESDEQTEKREAAAAFMAEFLRIFEKKLLESDQLAKMPKNTVERGLSQAIAKMLVCLHNNDLDPIQAAASEWQQQGNAVSEAEFRDLAKVTVNLFRFLAGGMQCLQHYQALIHSKPETRELKISRRTKSRPKAEPVTQEVARCFVQVTPVFKNGLFVIKEIGGMVDETVKTTTGFSPEEAVRLSDLHVGDSYPQYGKKLSEVDLMTFSLG